MQPLCPVLPQQLPQIWLPGQCFQAMPLCSVHTHSQCRIRGPLFGSKSSLSATCSRRAKHANGGGIPLFSVSTMDNRRRAVVIHHCTHARMHTRTHTHTHARTHTHNLTSDLWKPPALDEVLQDFLVEESLQDITITGGCIEGHIHCGRDVWGGVGWGVREETATTV